MEEKTEFYQGIFADGLDEESEIEIETREVKRWRFNPATGNFEPTLVTIQAAIVGGETVPSSSVHAESEE